MHVKIILILEMKQGVFVSVGEFIRTNMVLYISDLGQGHLVINLTVLIALM